VCILRQALGWYIYHILVRVHVGLVSCPPGRAISHIVIANVDKLWVSLNDLYSDITKCALIVTMDWDRRCVFAVYMSVELE